MVGISGVKFSVFDRSASHKHGKSAEKWKIFFLKCKFVLNILEGWITRNLWRAPISETWNRSKLFYALRLCVCLCGAGQMTPPWPPPWNIEVIRITWIRKQRLLVSTRIIFAKSYELMKVQKVWDKCSVTSLWKSPIDASALIRNEILAYYSTEIQLPTNITSGTPVAQWLKCRATNRKATGSIPADVIGIFHWHKILPIVLWPWGRLSL